MAGPRDQENSRSEVLITGTDLEERAIEFAQERARSRNASRESAMREEKELSSMMDMKKKKKKGKPRHSYREVHHYWSAYDNTLGDPKECPPETQPLIKRMECNSSVLR